MQYKALLAVGIALVAFQIASAHPVKRSCACGLKGVDVCGCNSGLIVRPSKPQKPFQPNAQRVICQRVSGPQEFKPLGSDLCAPCCGISVVTPAIVPRIPCTCGKQQNSDNSNSWNSGSSGCSGSWSSGGSDSWNSGNSGNSGSCGCGASRSSGPSISYGPSDSCGSSGPSYSTGEDTVFNSLASYGAAPLAGSNDFDIDVESGSCGSSNQGPYPADAVSLALATEMAQRASKKIREENLMFGPISKPIDGTIRQQKNYVPEDALYQVKNQIVELRVPSRGITAEEEAEATLIAAQQDEQESCGEANAAPFLSYNDLGYAPVEGGCPTFVRGCYTPSSAVVTDTFEYTVPTGNSGSSCSSQGPIAGGAYGGGIRTIGGYGNSGYGNSGSCTCACSCQNNADLSGESDGSSEDNSGEQQESGSSCGCGRY